MKTYRRSKKRFSSARKAWADIGEKTGVSARDAKPAHTRTHYVFEVKGRKAAKKTAVRKTAPRRAAKKTARKRNPPTAPRYAVYAMQGAKRYYYKGYNQTAGIPVFDSDPAKAALYRDRTLGISDVGFIIKHTLTEASQKQIQPLKTEDMEKRGK